MEVAYLRLFLKDIQKINDTSVKKQLITVLTKFKQVEILSDLPQVKKLKGHSEAYRMRVGNYRLGFFYNGKSIEFARFAKREDIYKLFP